MNFALTEEQNLKLERLQKMAFKIIYGFNIIYEDKLIELGMKTLQERREDLCYKFAISLTKSDRFREWVPERRIVREDLRNNLKYEEFYARTHSLYNSPLYSIRRRLNRN